MTSLMPAPRSTFPAAGHRSPSRVAPRRTPLLALLLATVVGLAGLSRESAAWARGPKAVALDAASAGLDFQIQGEYEGTVGGDGPGARLGAQVIALGQGTFRAVFLPGGLPGAGWDGKGRIEVEGRLDGESASFGGEGGWSARVAAGALAGKTDQGKPFELKKIQRHSPTEGARPPKEATVLFDGEDVSQWKAAQIDDQHHLIRGTISKHYFGDCTLHVEFCLPFQPDDRGQHRGNSGVYLQRRYEVQILDSFGLPGDNNDCGAVYTRNAPQVNMCYPPLSWQTYDIDFTAARFDAGGKKLKNAAVTVKHNGVLVQDRVEIPGPTGGGRPEDPAEPVGQGQLYLQDHKDPVVFRNVWIIPQ